MVWSTPFGPSITPAIGGGPAQRFGGAYSGTELRERQNRPAPIGSTLLVAGVAEVHQFPDRVVVVGLDQLTTVIPGDLDVTDEAEVGAVEVRQLGRDAFDALDGVDHPVDRQVVGTGERDHVAVLTVSVGVSGRGSNGLAGLLVGVDPFPLEGHLGRVVADQDV